VVVPAAISGSQHTRNWKRFQFPKVTVQYGDPIKFDQVVEDPSRDQAQAAAQIVFERIETLYYGLRREGRAHAVRASRAARAAERAGGRTVERA
jgi:1-acyl-sn-glycerol-3-phosphate acyltransferase